MERKPSTTEVAMNGEQDTHQTDTNTQAPAIDVEVVEPGTTSGSESSSSAGESSATSGTENEQERGGQLMFLGKQPIHVVKIGMRQDIDLDCLVDYFLLRWKGPRKWFLGIDKAVANCTVDRVNYTDVEAYNSGVVLVGCGRKAGDTGSEEEEGLRDTDISWTARHAEYMEIRHDRDVKRLIDETVSSRRYNMPDTTLGEIIPLLPSWRTNNKELIAWGIPSLTTLVLFERMPIEIGAGELTLLGYFESWVQGRPNVPPGVVADMRGKMEESLRNWRDNRMELATIVHAFTTTGTKAESIMAWLCPALDAMADHATARLAECERLAQIQPIEIEARRKIRGKRQVAAEGEAKASYKGKSFKLLVVHNANSHTTAAAWSLGIDILVAFRDKGDDGERFAIFMHRRRTYGFGMKDLARVLRYLYRARKGEIEEAYRDWHEMGCEGDYPGIDGLTFDATEKSIRNGTETLWAPKLRLPPDTIVEAVEAGLNDLKRFQWKNRVQRRWATTPSSS